MNLHVPRLLLQNPMAVNVLRSAGGPHFDQTAYDAGNIGPCMKPMITRKKSAR